MTQVSATASDITHILQSQPLRKSQCLSSNTFFWSKWKHPVFNSLLWIEASKALGCPSPLPAASLLRCKTSTCPISHPAAPGISFVYLLSLRGHWTPLFRKLNWAAWLYVLSSPFLLLCENYLLWEFLLSRSGFTLWNQLILWAPLTTQLCSTVCEMWVRWEKFNDNISSHLVLQKSSSESQLQLGKYFLPRRDSLYFIK